LRGESASSITCGAPSGSSGIASSIARPSRWSHLDGRRPARSR
jgi:hypothetical protein